MSRKHVNYSDKFNNDIEENESSDNLNENVSIENNSDVREENNYQEAIVNIDKNQTLNLRSENSTNSDIIKTLSNGEKLIVMGHVDNWSKIVTESGAEGYVMSQYIQFQ